MAIPSIRPQGSEGQPYVDEIKNKSPEELRETLNDKTTPDWYKKLIIEELARRASENENKGGQEEGDIGGPKGSGSPGIDGGNDEEDLAALWKLLASGKISKEQLEKLAEMLGVKPEDLEPLKGKVDQNAVPETGVK